MGWTSVISMYVMRKQLDRSGEVMLYVLIIISAVNSGQVVTMQEFTSEQNCTIALTAIKTNSRFLGTSTVYATCVVK
jgi:hypothetical protein